MAGTTTYFGISYPTSTDLVKDGALNMQTIATGFDSAVAIPTYNAQTGTTYTFALSDIGKTVTASNAGSSTYTIPPQASVVWPTGATLEITNLGAGVVTFAAGAGVTVTNAAATLSQYGSAALIRTGSNAWTVTPRSGGGASGLTLVKAQTIGTSVTSVTVTDAFSAAYDNYLITIAGGAATSNINFNMVMGSTTTGYYLNATGANWGTGVTTSVIGNNVANWFYVGTGRTTGLQMYAAINAPFLAKNTTITNPFIANDASYNFNGILADTTSYTAFTLAGGTFTGGTIRVYGYQNS